MREVEGGAGEAAVAGHHGVSRTWLGKWCRRLRGQSPAAAVPLPVRVSVGPRFAWTPREYTTPPSKIAASNTRHRAFTLFARAWDDVRRIFCFYRWNEQDADKLVPSLYRGRGGRGKPKPVAGGEGGVAARDQVGVAGWEDAPESG